MQRSRGGRALNLTAAITRNSIKTAPLDVFRAAFLFFGEGKGLSLIPTIPEANDRDYLKGFHDGGMTGPSPHE